ncbi:cell division protein FtsA [Aggregatilinea lenta]|uniref:cell division protein FtsA n=1 Tax=Aggregatilinea lenta TaxID=913108 RepID=UPI000E5B1EFE|nr:cell division protein FtsA [Aggregatilinea lenta]
MGELVVGIDVGTTKVCTIVGEVREADIHVLGVGIEPSHGMRKGAVVDVNALSGAISSSVHKAERTSGYEIGRAFVSLAGSHVESVNSTGVVGVSNQRGVQYNDLSRAMDAARAVSLPHGREVLHVIPRNYTLDEQTGLRSPIGMLGFRLEVEAHIITAATASIQNLEKCIEAAGVYVDRFILNPLAAGDAILTENEREAGVMVVDIGGGTTDIAMFVDGAVWHTAVIAVGGQHISNDIAHGLHLPFELAEAVKLEHGHADLQAISPLEAFPVQPFGEELPSKVQRADLVHIINARVAEIFELIMKEAKRSGYDSLLRAGIVLTGGSSLLPGMRQVAAETLNVPVRIAQPDNITGMVEALKSPAYSTSVGLLKLGLIMDLEDERRRNLHKNGSREARVDFGGLLKRAFSRLLPGEEDEG